MSELASKTLQAAGLTIGRLFLASIFILEGWSKLKGYEAAVAYMNRFGVPGALLPAVITVELGCGLMLAVGWQTRVAALALALFCILAALLFHVNFTSRNELLHFEKDLAIAGGLLVLAVAGAGRWSVAARSKAVRRSAQRTSAQAATDQTTSTLPTRTP